MNDEVLPKIPGEILGAARHTLPEARSCEENTQQVIVRLPDGTRAVVTFTRLRNRKGRGANWFWTPASAVMLED
jgi:hypothetical protein